MTPVAMMDCRQWPLLAPLWGGSFVFVSAVLEGLPPLTLVLSRMGFGAIGPALAAVNGRA